MIELPHLEILGLEFLTALFLSLFIVPATIALAHRVGAVDVPKERSSHTAPTTRLGGLGIGASVVLSCLMFLPLNTFGFAFLMGLLVIVATGLIDDIADIGPRWKFVGQIAAAGCFVWLGGGTLVNLGNFLGGDDILLDSWAVPLTIFCMVGGMNAFNLSDGLDGLAGGMAAVAATFFAYFAWHTNAPDLLLVCIALLGAVLGFLRYNSYPAKLFMGDCGSLALGYVLATVLVSGSQRGGYHISLATWVMVVALPLLDTLFVMGRRVRYGQSPFRPDRTHLHHRLMTLGLAHPAVVAVMYAVMALFGMSALALHEAPDWYEFVILCMAGVVLIGGIAALQHIGVSFKLKRRKRPYPTFRQWPFYQKFSRWLVVNTVPVSAVLLFLLCAPAATMFFAMPALNRHEALALLILAAIVAFYSQHRTQNYKGMLHGAVYISIVTLIFLYNLAPDASGRWEGGYLMTISGMAFLWVALKIYFRKNTAILMTSGFELLMVLLSWFLPFVVFPELHFPVVVQQAGQLACLQAVPFMLVTKIYFNIQPQGNKWVVGILVGALVMIALRGITG